MATKEDARWLLRPPTAERTRAELERRKLERDVWDLREACGRLRAKLEAKERKVHRLRRLLEAERRKKGDTLPAERLAALVVQFEVSGWIRPSD